MPERKAPNRMVWSGIIILALLLCIGLAASLLSPHDPLQTDLVHRLSKPSLKYPMGTDHLGRCVLSRLFFGARVSLLTGLCASLLSLLVGLAAGLASGLGRGWLGIPMRGLLDIGLAFPGLLLALVLVGAMGPSPASLVVGIAGAVWPWWGRLVNGLVISAKQNQFVTGGRVVGVSGFRMVRDYILPQIIPPLLVAASMKTAWIILATAGLGYLGLGVQPPTPEWGAMLQESRMYLAKAPWLMLAPGGAVTLVVLGCNLLAEGLRDSFQVRQVRGW